jgi:hypothetical protein
MRRFQFDVFKDREPYATKNGLVLPSLDEARAEAARAAGLCAGRARPLKNTEPPTSRSAVERIKSHFPAHSALDFRLRPALAEVPDAPVTAS